MVFSESKVQLASFNRATITQTNICLHDNKGDTRREVKHCHCGDLLKYDWA